MNLVGKKNLTPVKLKATTQIDQDAHAALSKLNAAAGNALVYALKASEAQEVLAKYPTNPGAGAVIDTSAWPILAAQDGTGQTIWDIASAFHAEVLQLKTRMAPIEKARLAAQVAVSGATTSDQVYGAAQVTWPT